MRPWPIIAALVLILAVGLQTYRLRGAQFETQALSASLAQAQAVTAAAAEAAAVHRAYIDRLTRQQAQQDALLRDLQAMEGRDAPLSDHLRAAAGRLWP